MERKYFGTDGIRGAADGPNFTTEFLQAFGLAIASVIKKNDLPPKIVLGRDTRKSGLRICETLATAFNFCGIEVLDAEIVPTPAIPKIIDHYKAGMGVAITASHNPYTDNGLKLFNYDGYKLPDSVELEIESIIDDYLSNPIAELTDSTVHKVPGKQIYLESLPALLESDALKGVKIALDTANGATAVTTREKLISLGAELIQVGDKPDGLNINKDLGSEYPDVIRNLVLEHKADIGIAHDGDGDRLILCDDNGNILDGDTWLAIVGRYLKKKKELLGDTVVATIMSNLGLEESLSQVGAKVSRTGVGDRYVLERMREQGFVIGGEASGHFILNQHSTTGDGLLAALYMLKILKDSGESLSKLKSCISYFPQKKVNLKVKEKIPFSQLSDMMSEVETLDKKLGVEGRIVLRYSGTEPKIRLLVEHKNNAAAEDGLNTLKTIIAKHLECL